MKPKDKFTAQQISPAMDGMSRSIQRMRELVERDFPPILMTRELDLMERWLADLRTPKDDTQQISSTIADSRMSMIRGSFLPNCLLCSGRGEIGVFDHAENGYRNWPCPECTTPVMAKESR